jgi:hypothetical protein
MTGYDNIGFEIYDFATTLVVVVAAVAVAVAVVVAAEVVVVVVVVVVAAAAAVAGAAVAAVAVAVEVAAVVAMIISKTVPAPKHYATRTCSKSGCEASPILTSIFCGGCKITFTIPQNVFALWWRKEI